MRHLTWLLAGFECFHGIMVDLKVWLCKGLEHQLLKLITRTHAVQHLMIQAHLQLLALL